MSAIAWHTLLDTLVAVETASPEDSGLLAFGAAGAGAGVFVERGRICWAAAPGMRRRLRDLLATSAHGVDFDAIYARCRAEGRMLGEVLVDEGWIPADELERVLRQHSAESLVALCRDGEPTRTWISRGSQGYAPRFTFRPVDVLLDVVALHEPELHDEAQRQLAMVDAPDRHGAAFWFGSRADVAIPVDAFGERSVQALWSLGRWTLALPRATRELGASPTFALATTTTGDTAVVWWRDHLMYVVVCHDRAAAAAITAYHLAAAEGAP